MDQRAQEIINQIATLSGQFGIEVTVSRVAQSPTPVRSPFGTPLNATTQTFTTQVIIESQELNETPTLAGGKPKEELRLIVQAGLIVANDEIAMNGHTYKVMFTQPTPLGGTSVVDFIHAERVVS